MRTDTASCTYGFTVSTHAQIAPSWMDSERNAPLLEDPRSTTTGSERQSGGSFGQQAKPLKLVAVISIVFFNVSGGPLGSEEIISSLGPVIGLGLVLVFSLVFSIPQAMITAELSTAFPSNGGYSIWVQAAFGTFWGIQESYWSWFSGVVDSALYPVLLYSTGQQLLSGMASGAHKTSISACNITGAGGEDDDDDGSRMLWGCMLDPGSGCALEYAVKLGTLALFCLPNAISSRVVGDFLAVLCLVAMLPFLVIACLSLPQWRSANFIRRPKHLDWATGVSTAYWNLSGFDSASTFAGEVEEPHKTFPRALFLSVAFIVTMYILPLFAGAGADPGWRCWTDGSLTSVALRVGGSWLGVWVVATSALSTWGLFASELLEDSFQLVGMAEMGLAPKLFATRNRFTGTPINCILLQFVIIGALVSLDFQQIMCVDNFFSAAAAALEFCACIKLRYSQPQLERPYRIPLHRAALALALLLPITLSLYVCYATLVESRESMLVVCAGLGVGLLLYLPFLRASRSEQMTVENLSRAASSATHNPVQGALLKRGGSARGSTSSSVSTRVSYSRAPPSAS